MWASSYLGIPFQPHGRTRQGCDCWGLVRLVHAEQRGDVLPDFEVAPDDARGIVAAIAGERPKWTAVALQERREFDVVVMRARIVREGRAMSCEMHVGVVTADGRILHTELPQGVACVPCDHPTLQHRITGVYRR